MKLLSTFILILLLSMPSFTQSKFGFKGGMNISSIQIWNNGKTETSKSETGLFGEVFMEVQLSQSFLFSFGGQFIQSGYLFTDRGEEYEYSLNYIDIPLMLKYRITSSEESTIGFYLASVLKPGFFISAKEKISFNSLSSEEDVNGRYDPVRLGIGLGGGFEIETERFTVIPEILYNISEINMIKSKGGNTSVLFDLTIGLGIRLK